MQTSLPPLSSPATAPVLELDGISFERDDRLLFSDISLQVSAGDIVQVGGPNGAGKTTLLRILTGALSATDGEVRWCGTAAHKCTAQFAADRIYLGHQHGLKTTLTPEENLAWLARLYPVTEDFEPSQALANVGLAGYEDVPCYSLSAGQQRRVALARLQVSTARLWILDEPFTAIDKQGVAELEQLLQQHAARGGMVLLTTHQPLSIDGVRTLMLGGEQ